MLRCGTARRASPLVFATCSVANLASGDRFTASTSLPLSHQ
jgi:hypothetical protein